MANIDSELEDLYAQLSSLSRSGKDSVSSSESKPTLTKNSRSEPRSSARQQVAKKSISKIVPQKTLSAPAASAFSETKINNVKSLFASELKERSRTENTPELSKFNKANLASPADKQNELRERLADLDNLNDEIFNTKVKDESSKKTVQNDRKLQKLRFREDTSFDIIDNSESAVVVLNREELIQNRSLFANNKKRKAGEVLADRDNSSYVNTSAKLLKDNNSFGPLRLKKYSSRGDF